MIRIEKIRAADGPIELLHTLPGVLGDCGGDDSGPKNSEEQARFGKLHSTPFVQKEGDDFAHIRVYGI